MEKQEDELDIDGNAPMVERHVHVRENLADKGYVGLESRIRSIVSRKKPVN